MRAPALLVALVVSVSGPAVAQTWDCGKLACDDGPVVLQPLDRGATTWLDRVGVRRANSNSGVRFALTASTRIDTIRLTRAHRVERPHHGRAARARSARARRASPVPSRGTRRDGGRGRVASEG